MILQLQIVKHNKLLIITRGGNAFVVCEVTQENWLEN
jgi:hypothetical protein